MVWSAKSRNSHFFLPSWLLYSSKVDSSVYWCFQFLSKHVIPTKLFYSRLFSPIFRMGLGMRLHVYAIILYRPCIFPSPLTFPNLTISKNNVCCEISIDLNSCVAKTGGNYLPVLATLELRSMNFFWTNRELTEVTLWLRCDVAVSCTCFCDPQLKHWWCE